MKEKVTVLQPRHVAAAASQFSAPGWPVEAAHRAAAPPVAELQTFWEPKSGDFIRCSWLRCQRTQQKEKYWRMELCVFNFGKKMKKNTAKNDSFVGRVSSTIGFTPKKKERTPTSNNHQGKTSPGEMKIRFSLKKS